MDRPVQAAASTVKEVNLGNAYDDQEPLVDYDLINEEEHQHIGDQNLLTMEEGSTSVSAGADNPARREESKDVSPSKLPLDE